jgi:hypothetical protein
VAEVKAYESDVGSNSEPKLERRRWIIDMEPSVVVATTKLQPSELDESEEGEHLFHSQMWVNDQNLDQGSNFTSKMKVLRIASKQMGL